MFSFGSIKPLTALGGALTIVRNNEGLYRLMKMTLEKYTFMSSKFLIKKIIKLFPVIMALDVPWFNKTCKLLANYFDYDYKEKVVSMVRGFKSTPATYLQTYRL